jgi:hypothetical protein
MTREEFLKIKKRLDDKARKKMQEKEVEYYSKVDVLSNLKKIARFRNKQTHEMIMNLVAKQLVSVSDMTESIDSMHFDPDPIPIELWEEKLVDILNYLYKFYASVWEKYHE